MILTYTIQKRGQYSPQLDEYFYDEQEIVHEVESKEVAKALANILLDEQDTDCLPGGTYTKIANILEKILTSNNLVDILADEYKDQIKEYFYDDAMEQWR